MRLRLLIFRIAGCFLLSGLFVSFSLAETTVEWPAIDGVSTEQLEMRFEEVFNNRPEDLSAVYPDLLICAVHEDKAKRLASITKETAEYVFKNSTLYKSYDVDQKVNKIQIWSTPEGCSALPAIEPELVYTGIAMMYRVPETFKEPLRVFSDFTTDIKFSMDGVKETKTKSRSKNDMLIHFPENPATENNSMELVIISDIDNKMFNSPIYSLTFVSPEHKETTLASMRMNNEPTKTIQISSNTNSETESSSTTYGNKMLMSHIGGKMHGVMEFENWAYKTDKTKDPVSRQCHNHGEKINVFRIHDRIHCEEVGEEHIGEPDVYLDAVFAVTYKSNLKSATGTNSSFEVNENYRTIKRRSLFPRLRDKLNGR